MKNRNDRKRSWKDRQQHKDRREQLQKTIRACDNSGAESVAALKLVASKVCPDIDFGEDLVVGKIYHLDAKYRNHSDVRLLAKGRVFGKVQTVTGGTPWEVMLNRLTEIKEDLHEDT